MQEKSDPKITREQTQSDEKPAPLSQEAKDRILKDVAISLKADRDYRDFLKANADDLPKA